ncbi:hypothetical protein [Rheinheimera aquimaris]|uniref:hypothetical protein n=1 Tax=Rheinheimera aquimaris TaxID=412437 RepID=UPI003A98541D
MDLSKFTLDGATLFSAASAAFAFLGCILSYKTYKRMTSKILSCSNSIYLSENGGGILKVCIRNKASVIGLDAVALNLSLWNNAPKLGADVIIKLHRILKHLFGTQELMTYASNGALKNMSKKLPATLSEEEAYLFEINLDEVMQVIINSYESFGSKSTFFVLMVGLKIHVMTGSGLWSFPVDFEAKYYLWKNYKDRVELTT